MKNIRTTSVATCMLALFAPAAVAQTNEFSEEVSQDWHDFRNWSEGHVPDFTEVALIKAGNTARITNLVLGGKAKSVEVEATAKLGVENRTTLHLRPTAAAPTALTVNGLLYFKGQYTPARIPARLILEVQSDQGVTHVVFTGSGVITAAGADDPLFPNEFYGPAQLENPSGTNNDPWGFEITSGLTMKGAWDIPLSIDNDGLVLVDGADTMDIYSPVTCSGGCPAPLLEELLGDGVFRVNHAGGEMLIGNRAELSGDYSAELEVSAGCMHFYDAGFPCTADGRLNMHDGKITVSGGLLLFDNGVYSAFPGIVGPIINVSDGLLDSQSSTGGIFNDTLLTITGGEFRTNHDVTFREAARQPEITITGAGKFDIQGAFLAVTPDGAGKTPIIINGNLGVTSLKCDHFVIENSTLSIAGGKFHVVGDVGQRDLFDGILTLSGGTYYAGGTFDGSVGSTVTVSGGTLDIRADNPFPDPLNFIHRGPFSFTGGKIKVTNGKTVRIGPDP